MARDSQRGKVYAWEKVAYPGYATDDMLTPEAAKALVMRVHQDVTDAGGKACPTNIIQVRFTKRKGGCASWGQLNFTPSWLPTCHVLHEIAHSLTLNVAPDNVRCTQGHGPRFVACLIALLEKYAGRRVTPALLAARSFEMKKYVKQVQAARSADGFWMKLATYEEIKKIASVQVDRDALHYWRTLLAKV